MDEFAPVVSTVLAFVAIAIAIWQGVTSRQQLSQARETNQRTVEMNSKTEGALENIQRLTQENREIAAELKTAFDERIGRIFDHYVDTIEKRAAAEHDDDRTAAEMAQGVLGWLGEQFKASVEEQAIESATSMPEGSEDGDG